MRDFRRLGFSFISSTQPRRVSHLCRYFQIARLFSATLESLSAIHFRKVNAALPPSHNVPELAKESKCEWHFEVPQGVGVGNFHRFWSQRVLNDLPLTVKKVVNHLEEIHPYRLSENVSQLQPTPLFPYRKTNPTKWILEMLTK